MTESTTKIEDVVKVGTFVVIGYIALKYVVPLLRGIGKAGDAAGNVIGNTLAKVLVGKGIEVNGSVLLPDVGEVKWKDITGRLASDKVGNNFTFTHLGKQYRLTGENLIDGTRVAELATAPKRIVLRLLDGAKNNALVASNNFDSSGRFFLYRNRLYEVNKGAKTGKLAKQKTRVVINGRTYVQDKFKVQIAVN